MQSTSSELLWIPQIWGRTFVLYLAHAVKGSHNVEKDNSSPRVIYGLIIQNNIKATPRVGENDEKDSGSNREGQWTQ